MSPPPARRTRTPRTPASGPVDTRGLSDVHHALAVNVTPNGAAGEGRTRVRAVCGAEAPPALTYPGVGIRVTALWPDVDCPGCLRVAEARRTPPSLPDPASEESMRGWLDVLGGRA